MTGNQTELPKAKEKEEMMKMKSSISAIALVLLLASISQVSEGQAPFDVLKYGAKADGTTDMSQALLSAWKAACESPTPSIVMIPAGKFAVGQVIMEGPCKAAINVVVQGTLLAPINTANFNKEKGWINFQNVDRFKLSGTGVFDGQGQAVWGKKCSENAYCGDLPINLRFDFITNGLVQDVTTKDSKQFHVNVLGCKNFHFQNFIVSAPADSPNTDGIHIGRSSGINITDTKIQTGDDCISIGDGSEQISITKVTCGPGHGISIGSLGKYPDEEPVSGITVRGCTMDNTDNGIRLKTWPASPVGSASDMQFEDITMNNVGSPILIDQQYCPRGDCKQQQVPSKIKISNVSFINIHGTTTTAEAVKLICSEGVPCENVHFTDINLKFIGGLATSLCQNVKPLKFGEFPKGGC